MAAARLRPPFVDRWFKENALFTSCANGFDDNHGYRPVPVEARTTNCTFRAFNDTGWIGIVPLPERRFLYKCVLALGSHLDRYCLRIRWIYRAIQWVLADEDTLITLVFRKNTSKPKLSRK